MPEIGVEHLSKDCRHETIDEEIHGGIDDHEELRDDAPEERPHADAVAVVLRVLDVLLYRENLRKRRRFELESSARGKITSHVPREC